MQPDKLTPQAQPKTENPTDNSLLLYGIFQRLKAEGPSTLQGISAEVLKVLNIEVNCLKSGDPTFSEMRRSLNTEPGILIANHPSVLDLFFVLSQIERKDVLIMLQRKRFAFFEKVMSKDNILRAPQGAEEMEEAIRSIKAHVDSGGLFIIFPSGGAETATGELSFKSGFRVLLPEIDPNAMVYSFYIDSNAGSRIQNDLIGPPQDSSDRPLMLAPELHVRPSKEPLSVNIDESYSTAGEWQEAVRGSAGPNKEQQNATLLKIFNDKFN